MTELNEIDYDCFVCTYNNDENWILCTLLI